MRDRGRGDSENKVETETKRSGSAENDSSKNVDTNQSFFINPMLSGRLQARLSSPSQFPLTGMFSYPHPPFPFSSIHIRT